MEDNEVKHEEKKKLKCYYGTKVYRLNCSETGADAHSAIKVQTLSQSVEEHLFCQHKDIETFQFELLNDEEG